jgi:hypothetical protein
MKLNASQLFKLCLCGLILLTMIFRLPYSLHRVVNIIEMLAFIYLAFDLFNRYIALSYFWIASAIIINPFLRLMISRIMWPIDAIWLTALLILILMDE